MKKIKSFRLEDRVLFEADAVAQIVEAVNNQEASNQEHNTEEQNEETQQTFESIANIQGSIIDVSTEKKPYLSKIRLFLYLSKNNYPRDILIK